jgi:Tol biopolymer transport system component/DNA-binding winged helix-turn-helix (wHTH) protein
MVVTIDNEKPGSDRLRIGQCVVVLSSREVRRVDGTGKVQRLTPKSVGVLLALVGNAGQVVTRDELFAEVWPDTMPTNDVLTQAVTQLRKAFAAADPGSDGTTYIETIAKTGYRLLAAVQWETDAGAAPEAGTSSSSDADEAPAAQHESAASRSSRRRVRRYAFLALGLLLLSSTVVMAWLLWMSGDAMPHATTAKTGASSSRVLGSPERPYRLITSTAAFETHPALSPDGALVVFAKEEEGRSTLWVQSTANAAPTRLVETPDDASDRFPVWSPDGRQIAFARFLPHRGCEVLVVSATGQGARRATRCDGTEMLSFDWSPDGRSLLFGSMTGTYASRGIRLLELESGRWSSLSYDVGGDDFDYAPRYSPDGQKIGFVRNPQVGDLWMMDADGSKATRLTNDAAEIRGWGWLSVDEMVFARGVDSESRLYRLDVATRLLRDMGVDDAQSPAVARHGGMIAFMRNQPQFALFRIPLGKPGGERQRLFASSGRDGQPMISPDGERLAFTSDRSGNFALWSGRLSDPDSLQVIEGLRPEARQPMDWSGDGRSLLVIGRDEQGAPGIYEVTPEDGHWKKLPSTGREPLQALYGPQPNTLLVVERDDAERMQLTLFDRSQSPWKPLASVEGVSQARLDRVGQRVLFTRLADAGLWQIDPGLAPGSVKALNPELPTRWRYRTWALAADGTVGYLHIGKGCASQFSSLVHNRAAQCLDAERASSSNGLSLAPDGSAVFVALAIADGGDIGVMRLPKRAPRRIMGVAKWFS